MREEQIRAMDTKLITLVGDEHKLTTAEVMDSGMLEIDPRRAEQLIQIIDRQSREQMEPIGTDPGKMLTGG
jgi:hypothetical protein